MRIQILSAIVALCIIACAAPEPTVRGLWKSTIKADDGVEVPIEVEFKDASVQTNAGNVALKGNDLLIEFPSGAVFSGKFNGPENPIKGSYIQPSNQVGGQRLAHSVELIPSRDGYWKGIAKPLA